MEAYRVERAPRASWWCEFARGRSESGKAAEVNEVVFYVEVIATVDDGGGLGSRHIAGLASREDNVGGEVGTGDILKREGKK